MWGIRLHSLLCALCSAAVRLAISTELPKPRSVLLLIKDYLSAARTNTVRPLSRNSTTPRSGISFEMSKYAQRLREAKSILATLEGEKPHSSVTDWVEILTSERYSEDSLDGVTELMESIRLLGFEGVTESSRAIRKKLKYGNVHRQIRALTVSALPV